MTHANTKAVRNAYKQYATATATTLSDVYTTWSNEKASALQYCLRLAKEYNACTPVYILTWNTFTFTAGFEGMHDGKPAFFYITRNHDRFIYIDEMEGTNNA